MRVGAISTVKYTGVNAKKTKVKQNTQAANSGNNVNFKGLKGAAIGAGAGLAWLGIMSVISGPFLPITLGLAAMAGGTGALAGSEIQDEFNDAKKDNDDNDD